MTAALVVGENFGDDLNQSLVRLVGTLLGACVGVTFLITLGVDIWSVVACAVVAGFLSRLVKLEQLSRVTLAVCMVTLLLHPDQVTSYGLYRLANTLIGAGIGLAVSLFVWPVRAEAAATRAGHHWASRSIRNRDRQVISPRPPERPRRQAAGPHHAAPARRVPSPEDPHVAERHSSAAVGRR
ncbi:membrane protein : Putative membrane protein OS=Nostoc sp. (strain ATCC 29411 / PCC 7524) GN=Nos7524_3831 PE=4 SV=1: FUSC [Gemmata massiliana]|uniref:Integral membrane bound transporter domain-containing protein n=2 Tax=Gemmata massiliana TaxID=1210884 RepID=A0A6P2CWJ7_9BACT|nr:membrane protein : Putative membrane protein OS=Nostoc sp. (strain ATCC 29411 / PCC 7524) GN=Nos7524_3831 PE=4 SV=1: FUSC [Gemmata massiliana]